jgi:hypothetical protein
MSGITFRRDHVKLVAQSYLRTSMRSGSGVIFLVLSMLIGLVLAGVAVFPFELVLEKEHDAAAALNDIVRHWGPSVIGAFTDSDPGQMQYLIADHPALITLFLVMLFAFLPFLVFLSGFNQTSGDIGSKGLRYQLLRTERANIFIGRFIATYVFALGAT